MWLASFDSSVEVLSTGGIVVFVSRTGVLVRFLIDCRVVFIVVWGTTVVDARFSLGLVLFAS